MCGFRLFLFFILSLLLSFFLLLLYNGNLHDWFSHRCLDFFFLLFCISLNNGNLCDDFFLNSFFNSGFRNGKLCDDLLFRSLFDSSLDNRYLCDWLSDRDLSFLRGSLFDRDLGVRINTRSYNLCLPSFFRSRWNIYR